MADLARKHGTKIDAGKLSVLLGVPVVFTVGNRSQGMDELIEAAIRLAESPAQPAHDRNVRYNGDIEEAIGRLERFLTERTAGVLPYPARWMAAKLIEDDPIVKERLVAASPQTGTHVLQAARNLRQQLAARFDDDPQIVMTDERYGFIAGLVT